MESKFLNLIKNNKEFDLYKKTETIDINFILKNTYNSKINKNQLKLLELSEYKINDIRNKKFKISKLNKLLFINLKGENIINQKKIVNYYLRLKEAHFFYNKIYLKYKLKNINFISEVFTKEILRRLMILTDKNETYCYSKELYLLHMENTMYYKIGIATDLTKRFSTIQTANPEKIIILSLITSNNIYNANSVCNLEKFFHALFSKNKKRGEWFSFSDNEIKIVLDIYSDFKKED